MTDATPSAAQQLGIDIRTSPRAGQRTLIVESDRGTHKLIAPDGLVIATREEWNAACLFAKACAGLPTAVLAQGRVACWDWIAKNHKPEEHHP